MIYPVVKFYRRSVSQRNINPSRNNGLGDFSAISKVLFNVAKTVAHRASDIDRGNAWDVYPTAAPDDDCPGGEAQHVGEFRGGYETVVHE